MHIPSNVFFDYLDYKKGYSVNVPLSKKSREKLCFT